MAKPSVLAGQLQRLLNAKGWTCKAERYTIEAEEPAFLRPISHTWLAGEANSIDLGQLTQHLPERIIVPDDTTRRDIERLEDAARMHGRQASVETVTRFIDLIWNASLAAERARLDASVIDPIFDGEYFADATPDGRHVAQHVRLDGIDVPDNRLLEVAFSKRGSSLAILADAGLGKSELLQWHEWRYAVLYQSASTQHVTALPSVALRVPLRGLRTLSLDAVAHYLSQPDADNGLPALRQIDTGGFLLELLRLGRVVLLLDGIDELPGSRESLEEGLRELRRATLDGAKIAFSGRVGHLLSAGSIAAGFSPQEIARIEPMTRDSAVKLLTKHKEDHQRIERVLSSLAGTPAQGIPLFLLLAFSVEADIVLRPEVAASRTRVLLELLRLFCERDETRLGVSSNQQMDYLTEFAHWTNLVGELSEARALEYLGIDPTESAASILINPHALLTRRDGDNVVSFKYSQFFALFSAKALADDWEAFGVNSVLGEMRSRRFDDSVIEHLARLVSTDHTRLAWREATESGTSPQYPLVRRNLMALALAQLEDEKSGETTIERARFLESILGKKELIDLSLTDLSLVRLNFSGWRLARLSGSAGSIMYCDGFAQCDFDASIYDFASIETCDFPMPAHDDMEVERAGVERLRALVRPLVRRGGEGLATIVAIDHVKDNKGWLELRRLNLAKSSRQFRGGPVWMLTDNGKDVLTSFISADDSGDDAIVTLLRQLPTLRQIVSRLGAAGGTRALGVKR